MSNPKQTKREKTIELYNDIAIQLKKNGANRTIAQTQTRQGAPNQQLESFLEKSLSEKRNRTNRTTPTSSPARNSNDKDKLAEEEEGKEGEGKSPSKDKKYLKAMAEAFPERGQSTASLSPSDAATETEEEVWERLKANARPTGTRW